MDADFDYGRKPRKRKKPFTDDRRPSSREWKAPPPQRRPSAESRELAGEYVSRMMEALSVKAERRQEDPLPSADEEYFREAHRVPVSRGPSRLEQLGEYR